MLPRSKLGPSWANEVDQSQSSIKLPDPNIRKSKKEALKEAAPNHELDHETPQEGVSDMEWMRQRMTQELRTTGAETLEQSEEEDEDLVHI
jgi:hypothetical protein